MEKQSLKKISEDDKREMRKEVLRRASKEEKQEHKRISSRRVAIGEKIIAIGEEWNNLIVRSKENKSPRMATNSKSAVEMSNVEFNEYMRQSRKDSEDHFAWSSKSFAIMTEQLELIHEIIELITESSTLGEEEKWLLLSIALRSQPNLMKYMTNCDEK